MELSRELNDDSMTKFYLRTKPAWRHLCPMAVRWQYVRQERVTLAVPFVRQSNVEVTGFWRWMNF